VRINSSCRGKDVFLILVLKFNFKSTCPPVNDNIIELLLTISALRRSSAKTINVLIPYFGYAR
jgi:ribose-phosphate pyrophosphokinase